MDVVCPICGASIDQDEIHEIAGETFHEKWAKFKVDGCKALGFSHEAPKDLERAAVASEMMAVLGDDVDAVASMMDLFDA